MSLRATILVITSLVIVAFVFIAGLATLVAWTMRDTSPAATVESNAAELQRLSGLLGVQFADTTELVQHGDGGDRTGKYHNWFVRDLGTTNELRARFKKLGEEIPASLGSDGSRKEIAVGMNIPNTTNSVAYGYQWDTSGIQYYVTLYSVNGSDWAKIMSFK